MAEITFYAEASDGYLESNGLDYATTRNGSNPTVSSNLVLQAGQRNVNDEEFFVWEAFLNFDLSGHTGTPTSAALSLWLISDSGGTDFTVEARARDWGDTLTGADWVPGGDLAGLTLLASIDTATIGATGAYKALTSEAALLTAIETALAADGILRLMLCSSRTTNNNAPPSFPPVETVSFSSTDTADTTQDPMLVVDGLVAAAPVITDVSPAFFMNDDLIAITGTALGGSEGTVILSPADDPTHLYAKAQPVDSWSSTEIMFTVDGSGLNSGPKYIFVVTADGQTSNAFPVNFNAPRGTPGFSSALPTPWMDRLDRTGSQGLRIPARF